MSIPNSERMMLFERVYKRHMNALGTEKRESLGNVKKVIWDEDEKCLKVYFDSGDWWHYLKDETWF